MLGWSQGKILQKKIWNRVGLIPSHLLFPGVNFLLGESRFEIDQADCLIVVVTSFKCPIGALLF